MPCMMLKLLRPFTTKYIVADSDLKFFPKNKKGGIEMSKSIKPSEIEDRESALDSILSDAVKF